MNNLKRFRKEKGLGQVEISKLLGIGQSSYSRYEAGLTNIPVDILTKLTDILGKSTDEILGLGREEPAPEPIDNIDLSDPRFAPRVLTRVPIPDPDSETGRVPILGAVRAGYDNYMVENVEGWLRVDPCVTAVHAGAYALRVKGDSMEPDIHHGDFVICYPDAEVRNNDIAIVSLNGDIGTVKRVRFDKDGLTLIPANAKYKPSHYSPEDVLAYPVTILARVNEIRRKI